MAIDPATWTGLKKFICKSGHTDREELCVGWPFTAEHTSALTQLTHLTVEGLGQHVDDLYYLDEMLHADSTAGIVSGLAQLSGLKHLSLKGSGNCCRQLPLSAASFLSRLTGLTHLSLKGHDWLTRDVSKSEAAAAVTGALRGLKQLQHLDLRGTGVKRERCVSSGVDVLANVEVRY